MKRLMKKIGKILVIALSCLSVGAGVRAAGTSMTEVQIAIEGTEGVVASGEENKPVQKMQSVQTGDNVSIIPYLLMIGMAVGITGVCVIKKKRKGLVAIFVMFLSVFLINNSAYAAETTENVSVTVPSSLSVSFDETGENSIGEFGIQNQSLVPITIEKVNVTECNDWKLCDTGEEIPVNTKKMVFLFEGQCIKASENVLDITIEENSSKICSISIGRGAWTTSAATETALQLEFEYTIGKKQFQLTFDENGGNEQIDALSAYNGDTVTLPSPERTGFVFGGWEGSEGNLYTDQFVMPIGDVTLTAKWKESVAYALYIEEDQSLRFIRSTNVYTAGSMYRGMTVTAAYTGFEDAIYSSETQVPWYDQNYYETTIIKKVSVEGDIQPKSTAHWFHWMYDCESFDLQSLDTVKVTDMSYMFAWAGFRANEFEILGVDKFKVYNTQNMSYTFAYTGRDANEFVVDLSRWDVSSVTDMSYMFAGTGYFSANFDLGDISTWNVSRVKNMSSMFRQTGYSSNWSLNCRKWDVTNVTSYVDFNLDVKSKVTAPRWVN